MPTPSKYTRHQSAKECDRRIRQVLSGKLTGTTPGHKNKFVVEVWQTQQKDVKRG